jgi:cytochrome c-type biogenesis protein CcmH
MTLSAFERVVVGARVSKSGQPMPSPGDLQGLSAPVKPGQDTQQSVTIDQVVEAK